MAFFDMFWSKKIREHLAGGMRRALGETLEGVLELKLGWKEFGRKQCIWKEARVRKHKKRGDVDRSVDSRNHPLAKLGALGAEK